MKVSIKCFVCSGTGKVYDETYILAGKFYYTVVSKDRTCKCCSGKGRLTVATYNELTDYSKLPF